MTVPWVAAAAALAAAGCAQILGLDDTPRRDASGPGLCDAPIDCSAAAPRAVCGQLVDAVTEAPIQRAGATGAVCLPSETDGPCGFSVAAADGATEDELFTTLDQTVPATAVDDCGRFRIEGLLSEKLAVIVTPVAPVPMYRKTVRAILYNETQPLVADTVVPMVAETRVQQWQTETGATIPEAILLYFRGTSMPVSGVEAKIDTSVVPLAATPPAAPYALYFAGARFESTIDPQTLALQMKSSPNGTGLVVPSSTNPFTLGGLRAGSNCDEVVSVRLVPGTLFWIDLQGC